jgi:hypothetical protein
VLKGVHAVDVALKIGRSITVREIALLRTSKCPSAAGHRGAGVFFIEDFGLVCRRAPKRCSRSSDRKRERSCGLAAAPTVADLARALATQMVRR